MLSDIKKNPAFSMGRSKRGEERKTAFEVPGPGQYPLIDTRKTKGKSPSWTMGVSKRSQEFKDKLVPGPGAYEIKPRVILEFLKKKGNWAEVWHWRKIGE
jgi:hypothetical protein